MSGGGKTSTSSSSVSIPPEVLARYNAVNARAEETAQQPFQEYGGEFVSPLSQTQQAGIQSTNVAAGQAQPYYNAATGLTLSGARDVGPLTQGQIGYYQNPYTQAVVDPTVQALQQQFGQQNAAQQAQAIKAGGLGGGGDARARAMLAGQQGLAFGQAIAPLYSQGYDKAAALAQSQQGVVASDLARRMQAGTQIANLGTGAQTAGLQGAAAQLQAGQQEQQTQQALDTAKYQQFLQKQRYPFDVTQFLANIAEGTGALSGSTTTTTSPRGLFGNRGGAMTGRHAKYAGGGLVPEGFDESSMGGAVMPDMEGMGFARGGYATDGGVGPYSNTSLLNAGTGIVPPPMQTNYKLMVSQAKIPESTGGLGDALQRGQQMAGLYKFGKEGLIGTPKTSVDPTGGAGLIGGQGQWGGENVFSKLKDFMKPAAAHGGLILEREHHAGYTGNVAGDDYDDEDAPKKKEMNNRAEVPETFLTPSFLQAGAQHPTLQTAGGGGGGGKSSNTIGQLGQLAGAGNAAMKLGKGAAGLFGGAPSAIPEVIDLTTPVAAGAEAAGGTGLLAGLGEGLGSLAAFIPFLQDGGRVPHYDYGGLVMREHHDGSEGNVAGEAPAAQAEAPPADDRLDRTLGALRRIESGGKYDIVGPASRKGDRPYGAYQVMGANIPSWTEAALGRRLTPEEFLKDKEAQDATVRHRAGLYLKQYDDPRQVASMWLSGRPIERAGNAADVLGTDVPKYLSMFDRYYGGKDLAPADGKKAGLMPPADIGRTVSDTATGLFDKATSPSFAVPALGFLGSMLSSKSRTLAGALGEGMLGGVGAYQANKKQEQETAKNLVEMLGNRFERQLVNGQVIYRNKLTGSEIPASQMANTAAGMFKNAGLDPKDYGIAPPSAPTAPGLVPATGAAPSGVVPAAGAPGAAPEAAPGATSTPAAPGEKPPAAGAKPPVTPTNPSDMTATQLRAYYEKNPEAAGLVGDDDPRVIRAKIKALKSRAEDFRSKLNDNAGATEADRQAQEEEKRLDKLLDQASSHQSAINQKLNEQQAAQSGEFEKEILKRQELYQRARGNWERLGDIYSELKTGRAETFKADLASWADGFGIPLPGLQQKLANAADVDAATKITMQEVYDAMARENLVRAPAASAKGLSQTVPGPNLTPGAVYEIVGKNLGELEHVRKRDDAYLDQARGTVPAKFLRDYDRANPSSLKEDVARGLNMLTINPAVPRETINSLYTTYGPHGYKPKGMEVEGGAPAATPAKPAVPEVGTVMQGYRFKGGNPADPNSWTKVQ
jgi:hypothetical protein